MKDNKYCPLCIGNPECPEECRWTIDTTEQDRCLENLQKMGQEQGLYDDSQFANQELGPGKTYWKGDEKKDVFLEDLERAIESLERAIELYKKYGSS